MLSVIFIRETLGTVQNRHTLQRFKTKYFNMLLVIWFIRDYDHFNVWRLYNFAY